MIRQSRTYDRSQASCRPRAHGKFLYRGDEKLYLRGVTYGSFRSREDGNEFPYPERVRSDFEQMRLAGINAVRTYTAPPRWLLDLAQAEGLLVLAGLPWEHHIAFLDSSRVRRSIRGRVRDAARGCAEHPALLGFAVGNEIPAGIVRWHGGRRVEKFVESLYEETKDVDPEALVTYVNYPTTEYLQLPFVDFSCLNVYLEARDNLEAYLARLHNLIGERPLVMAEVGLDSRRNGLLQQAQTLEWQVDAAFEHGCAGTFVFSWTDEWHRGGEDIVDWDFGLVDRQRQPKPALAAVSRAYTELAPLRDQRWPKISVVVCTHNGGRWIEGCLESLRRVDYPNWEAIVVSDGSTDATNEIVARSDDVRLVTIDENVGLAAARNMGLLTASGEIVAYVDDDARPDPHWLRYLALAFDKRSHGGVGGPNLTPVDERPVAACIGSAPGGPNHVLLEDEIAEHIPGCNMAFWRDALEAIGGFDPRFRIAGDDVDVCWRLQDAGHTIGFSPSAVVWHHRRDSVFTYVKQQYLYGKAEGLLHQKWPERYNRLGHLSWAGRVYGRARKTMQRAKIGYGSWGERAFQSIYAPAESTLRALPAMPEWYLLLGIIAVITALGVVEWPLLFAGVPLAAGILATLWTALVDTREETKYKRWPAGVRRFGMQALTFGLHLVQPLARLGGRLEGGITPWGRSGTKSVARLWGERAFWTENWAPPERWLGDVERRLCTRSYLVNRGSDFDRWDLQVRTGPLGVARVLFASEDHGGGRQLGRFRWWVQTSRIAVWIVTLGSVIGVVAALTGHPLAAATAFGFAAAIGLAAIYHCAGAAGAISRALVEPPAVPEPIRIRESRGRRTWTPTRAAGEQAALEGAEERQ